MENCEKFRNKHTFTNIDALSKEKFDNDVKPDIYFYSWDSIDSNSKPSDYVFTNTHTASINEENSNTSFLVNLHVPFHQDSFNDEPWFLFYITHSDGNTFKIREQNHVNTFSVRTGDIFVFNSLDAHSLELSEGGKNMLEQFIKEPTEQNRDRLSYFLFQGVVINLPHKPSYDEAVNLFQELDLSLENNRSMRL